MIILLVNLISKDYNEALFFIFLPSFFFLKIVTKWVYTGTCIYLVKEYQ